MTAIKKIIMKNVIVILIFTNLFSTVFTQNEKVLFRKTNKKIDNDIPFCIYQFGDGSNLFVANLNDSTNLYKRYIPGDTSYLIVYEANLNGQINGQYYAREKNQFTMAYFINGFVKYSLTQSTHNNDTLAYEQKINDTLYVKFSSNDSLKTICQTDSLYRENGFFRSYYIKTNTIKQIGYYRLISEDDILDEKLFIKEYNKDSPNLRIIPSFNYGNKPSIKVGEWNTYSQKGVLLEKKLYLWNSLKTFK